MDQIPDDPKVIKPIFEELTQTFLSGKTRNTSFRKTQLKNLLRGLDEMKDELNTAWVRDLGGNKFSSELLSWGLCHAEIEEALEHIDDWNKPISCDTPFSLGPGKSYMKPEPLGIILIIGAWNYPLTVTVPYAATAIAAGNCVVLKTSEMAAYTSMAINKLFETYLDKSCFRVIQGQVEVAKAITTYPFDKIFFTGSTQKGKLVAEAAAKNLIPCVLELGGKSPTVIDRDADVSNAALRVAQGRFTNSGQTCIANDYVFVHKDIKARFLTELKAQVQNFWGEDAQQSPDYGRIINEFHCQRLKSYLDEKHGGTVVCGGKVDLKDRFVAPTVVDTPSLDSQLMKDEIFGPILPVYEYEDINKVIDFINKRPKPLALYFYGNKSKNYKTLIDNTSSGSVMLNDSIFQFANSHIPFGGVGASGMGNVHGYHGFKECVHFKAVFEKGTNNGFPYNMRFPPYTDGKQKFMRMMLKKSRMTQRSFYTGVGLLVLLGLGIVALRAGWIGGFFKAVGTALAGNNNIQKIKQ